MAYMRSLTARGSLFARRYQPSVSSYYALHDDDDHHLQQPSPDENYQLLKTSAKQNNNLGRAAGFAPFLQDRRCAPFALPPPSMAGPGFGRLMSTTVDSGSEKIDFMTDVAGVVLSDTAVGAGAVASQAPAVSEVAVAAADSYLPVAALQYLIDGVQSLTGANWWASIVITTFLIRGSTIPLLINQVKAATKLSLMRPRLEEIKEEMQNTSTDPNAVAEGQKRMKALFREYGVHPFTPMKGLFIQGPIFVSFYLAIANMVEKVPSFKVGGIYWFTDLSTPDSLYIFPFLAGLSFLINVELNTQEGMEGNPMAHSMKNVMRGLAVATVFFTHAFPKAIFCYWISSNLFSLAYGQVIKRAAVKKFLGIPNLPVQPPASTSRPDFSWAALRKHAMAAMQESPAPSVQEVESPKPKERRVSESPMPTERKVSSSSVLSQRIKTLEKQVKGRSKGKKSKR